MASNINNRLKQAYGLLFSFRVHFPIIIMFFHFILYIVFFDLVWQYWKDGVNPENYIYPKWFYSYYYWSKHFLEMSFISILYFIIDFKKMDNLNRFSMICLAFLWLNNLVYIAFKKDIDIVLAHTFAVVGSVFIVGCLIILIKKQRNKI